MIRPSCCPYLERREAEKYLESVAETADNPTLTYTNINVPISPGFFIEIFASNSFQVLEVNECQNACLDQQQIEGRVFHMKNLIFGLICGF